MIEPYYDRGGVVLYNADCLEVMQGMPDASVDVVFADPPYNVNKAAWDTEFPTFWLGDAARVAGKVLAITPGVMNLLELPATIGPMRYRWTLSIRILNGTTRGPVGFGNWIACLVYTRDDVSIYTQQQDATEIVIRGHKPDHPSPKPYEAMTWILSRLPGTSILDPFAGSGTTLRAAKDLGWEQIIGIEKEREYCALTVDRLAQEVLALDVA